MFLNATLIGSDVALMKLVPKPLALHLLFTNNAENFKYEELQDSICDNFRSSEIAQKQSLVSSILFLINTNSSFGVSQTLRMMLALTVLDSAMKYPSFCEAILASPGVVELFMPQELVYNIEVYDSNLSSLH